MDKDDKVIYEFPVLHHGWGCDSTAWVMERPDGTRYLKQTSNLLEYIEKSEQLYEKLSEYADVVEKTKVAIKLLSDGMRRVLYKCEARGDGLLVKEGDDREFMCCDKPMVKIIMFRIS